MSMKRILGMMLASRMAGRGMRRGGFAGGGLGGLAAGGLLGSRGGFGRKAGLATLGYLAYRAYQDHQARTAGQPGSGTTGSPQSSGSSFGGSSAAGGSMGGLGGIIKSVSDALSGESSGASQTSARAPQQEGGMQASASAAAPAAGFGGDVHQHEQAAEAMSEATALLLLRGMITAANADGTISPEERGRIMDHADEGDPGDRAALERELASPRPLDELLAQVTDRETAEEFYLASRMAVDGETNTNRAYLSFLRERLGLGEQDAAEIEKLAS